MSERAPSCLALSGGVGGTKLVLGLTHVLDPDALLVVANTGDESANRSAPSIWSPHWPSEWAFPATIRSGTRSTECRSTTLMPNDRL